MTVNAILCAPILSALALSSAAAEENQMVPFAEVPFMTEAPDQPQMLGPVWGDRAVGPAGTYLKTPGGFQAPLHSHTADYRGIVIQGTWSHWVPEDGEAAGVPLPVGSYWVQIAGQPHRDACLSETQCVILLINDEPYQTELR